MYFKEEKRRLLIRYIQVLSSIAEECVSESYYKIIILVALKSTFLKKNRISSLSLFFHLHQITPCHNYLFLFFSPRVFFPQKTNELRYIYGRLFLCV